MDAIVKVSHLTKSFGKREILHDISFHVEKDEIVGFVGPNGAGKSTTLKCIAGLYQFTQGDISICGHDIKKERGEALKQMGVSIEYPALYPDLNGNDHFSMVQNWRKESKGKIAELKDFSGLKDALKRPVKTYSMGMKQRLMLSLTMIGSPKLLLLDEPTNGLDPQAVFELREKLLFVKDQGTSVLLSSHQLGEIEKMSNRILFIREGSIVKTINAADLHHQSCFLCKLSSQQKALQLCNEHYLKAHLLGEHVLLQTEKEMDLHHFLQVMIANHIHIYHISEQMIDLESYYKKIYEIGENT